MRITATLVGYTLVAFARERREVVNSDMRMTARSLIRPWPHSSKAIKHTEDAG